MGFYVLGLLLSSAIVHGAVVESGDSWERGAFQAAQGKREFRFFVPASVQILSSPSPLVVLLHGCKEDASSFAAGTGMNDLARRHRFSVLYPEQTKKANPLGCWNWQLPVNQRRRGGEAALLAPMVSHLLQENPNLDRSRVYVAGMSAGGAMAQILGVCFPDMFAASAVHSGMAFHAARSTAGAVRAMGAGPAFPLSLLVRRARECAPNRKHVTPTLVFQGERDTVVVPANGASIVDQVLGMAGLDRTAVLSKVNHPAGKKSHAHSVTRYGTKSLAVVEFNIQGLGHAWAGGNSAYLFNDENGPDASRAIWLFFAESFLP